MNDRKPVIIAVAVGSLALAANGAAAMVAISASSAPPEAVVFGITGLAAAFTGLIATIIWAFRDDAKPARRRERVFTPWSEQEDDFAPRPESAGRSSLALARMPAPAPAPMAAPAATEGRVIYLAEWLKARGVEHANA